MQTLFKDFDNIRFNGSTYNPQNDKKRLVGQIERVYVCMANNDWLTLDEIAQKTGDPHASISAQLRNLRKERFGKYNILKRSRGDRSRGLWEYKLGTMEVFDGSN